jgi:hypothetical protein
LIQKFLVVGSQIYYASNRTGLEQNETNTIIDLEMPIQVFWDSEKLLKEADYLIASSEPKVSVNEVYRRFFKIVAPYATDEKSKTLLFEKSGLRNL